jgi:hypothetical protein
MFTNILTNSCVRTQLINAKILRTGASPPLPTGLERRSRFPQNADLDQRIRQRLRKHRCKACVEDLRWTTFYFANVLTSIPIQNGLCRFGRNTQYNLC